MRNKKHFILSSLACLSLLGGGTNAREKQQDKLLNGYATKGTMLTAEEHNNAMLKQRKKSVIGAGLSLVATNVGSFALGHLWNGESVDKLTEEVKKLKEENEKLKKELADAKNKEKPENNNNEELLNKIAKLEEENGILRKGYSEYQKAVKQFFNDLGNRTMGLGNKIQELLCSDDLRFRNTMYKLNEFYDKIKKEKNIKDIGGLPDEEREKIKLDNVTLSDFMCLWDNYYKKDLDAMRKALDAINGLNGQSLERFLYNLESLCNGYMGAYLEDKDENQPAYTKSGLWLNTLLGAHMDLKYGLKASE